MTKQQTAKNLVEFYDEFLKTRELTYAYPERTTLNSFMDYLRNKQTEVVEETRLVVGRGKLIPVEKFGKKEYVSFSWVMEHLATTPPTLNITTLKEDKI